MLLSIEFPFVDTRAFIEGDVGLLGIPNWPAAVPDQDFVRSFGAVRKRPLGGLPGWIGENPVCNAQRALHFVGDPAFREVIANQSLETRFAVAYRRLYFDGYASGKFSVGLSSRGFRKRRLSRRDTQELFWQVLNLPVAVRDFSAKTLAHLPLWSAGRLLTNLYAHSSARTTPPAALEKWHVQPIPPILFLVLYANEEWAIPFPGHPVTRERSPDFDVAKYTVRHGGRDHTLWVTNVKPGCRDFTLVRDLRIGLTRLYTEYSSLLRVLRSLAVGELTLTPRSAAAQRLQRYLEHSFGVISRKEARVEALVEPETVELAREILNSLEAGWSDSLVAALQALDLKLQQFDIRLNLRRNVKEIVDRMVSVNQYIAKVEVNVEKTTVIGPINNSIVNIDSVLEQVTQSIGSAPGGDDATKQQLAELITQLKTELAKAAPDSKDAAEAVADYAKKIVEDGTQAQPNPLALKITASGLKQAAENIAGVMPTVLTIATSIVKTVFQIAGIPVP